MADTPGTPESLRVSDAERDRAVEELKKQFADGRLSHDTFMVRMNHALGARNRGQLTGLFDDLPARRGVVARAMDAMRDLTGRLRGPGLAGAGDGAGAAQQGADWRGGDWPGVRGPGAEWPVPVTSNPLPLPRTPAASAPPVPLLFPRDMGTTFTIGRHQGCDLYIADMSVSRLHARLARDSEGWLLTDLGSTNGTRLNGWRVRQTVPVRAGDQVRFGSVDFVIRHPQDPQSPDALLTTPLDHAGPPEEAVVGLGPVTPVEPPETAPPG